MVNTHIDQVLYFGGILSRQQFYLLFMWSNMVNTQYRANHVLVRFFPWEDFILGRIQSFDLSLHYCKHSTISSFVYFKFFCRGRDFVPTTTLPYSMYTIIKNTHIDQVLYFGGILSLGTLSRQQLYRILCKPLQ